MNQPLHNNAIPNHPAIAAQIQGAQGVPAQTSTSEPAPNLQTEQNASALWDAFTNDDSIPDSPSIPEPVVQSVTPPAPPSPPQELPPSIDDLLSGPGAPAPVQTVEQPVAAAPPLPPQPQGIVQQAAPDMAMLQKQAMDYLMGNEYKLSDEERTQLISAPDEVMPRLAARMHVGIATQLAQQVAQAIPAMIQQHMETHVKAQRAEMEFFSRYPKLNRDEWKPTIAESLQMVRQMKPQASREEIITEGAALAAFRIQSKMGNRHQPQPPQLSRGPTQPYVPVSTGGGMTPPTNPQAQNPWAQLAMEDWDPFS